MRKKLRIEIRGSVNLEKDELALLGVAGRPFWVYDIWC